MEPRIVNHLQNKRIEFDRDTLENILGVNNEGLRVYEVKSIPTIGDFVYDKVIAQHNGQLDCALGAKIKIQDLLLCSRILHRIIAHNILPKKEHYDEVTFMDMYLIDYMIKECCISLLYIMIKNIIMAHDQK